MLTQFDLCYLATPYSKYEKGIEAAFEDAARLAGRLITRGVKIYSPITHTHPIAIHGHLDPLDHNIWIPFDESMMRAAQCLVVAMMDGWEASYGIKHEIQFFLKAGKPVFLLDPDTLHVEPYEEAEAA